MSTKQQSERKDLAVGELHRRCPGAHSQRIVDSLSVGLTRLRNTLLVRTRDDVERNCGTDSMLGKSLSEMEKQVQLAKIEIEAYACIVIDEEVTENGYIVDADKWFLDWMFRLRLGEGYKPVFERRVEYYRSQTVEQRRLKFLSVLEHAQPESAKAPLVLFRLFPRSVRILAAEAFDDPLRSQELRAEQASFLPAIADCHECHGRVLDNEDSCRCCGNPLWNYAFLLSD